MFEIVSGKSSGTHSKVHSNKPAIELNKKYELPDPTQKVFMLEHKCFLKVLIVGLRIFIYDANYDYEKN